MSHYMTALAMKQKGLKPATKIVLYWLADHHNGETNRCFPSLSRLCECAEMGKTALVGHLDALEEMGLIERVKTKREDGGWSSTSYILHFKEPLVRKTDNPCSESDTTLVRKANTNLVSNNLGKEPLNISLKSDDGFEDFWSIVPRRIGKGAAEKAWKAALKQADKDTILEAMSRYAQQREGQDPKFTPHPATWLNQKRWLDEDQAPQSDFYDRVQQHSQEQFNELPATHRLDHVNDHRLLAPVSAPDAPGQRGMPEGNRPHRGRDQQSGFDFIKPRRFS